MGRAHALQGPSLAGDAPGVSVGVGWRAPHYAAVLSQRPRLGFLEVHSENFFGEGGAARAVLQAGRAAYDISLHGVGLALGSAVGLDPWHLDRLADLVARVDPIRVSDHASFARVRAPDGRSVIHGSDLLPIAFTRETLDRMVRHVTQVQERLRRPLLVENLSAYLRWREDEMDEASFFNELTRRSGCQMLLDLNNLVVNALNRGACDPVQEACALVDRLTPQSVGEIHLAGHVDDGVSLVIDDHGSPVPGTVWQVYAHALVRLGACPTLIEWDTQVPDLSVLLAQAGLAERVWDGATSALRAWPRDEPVSAKGVLA